MTASNRSSQSSFRRTATAAVFTLPALALTGCYVIPLESRSGNPVYAVAPAPAYAPGAGAGSPPVTYAGSAQPSTLHVRLYPANDLATQTGMMSGTVTNTMSGKGRFQFEYRGELLSGEATRVNGDERRGVASAYGSRGTYVSCDYQMMSAQQGAGHCQFNNGARYEVHIGG